MKKALIISLNLYLQSQGQTLDEVIIDFDLKKTLPHGSFYTALSRVKFGDNFYLKRFQPAFIRANPEVETKLSNMEKFAPYSFKKVYLDSFIYETYEEIKIGYININSLFSSMSHVFLNNDKNLLRLDLLCVADTRLTMSKHDDKELEKHLDNWNILCRNDSSDQISHMGTLLLSSKKSQYEDMLSGVRVRVDDDNEHNFVQMQVMKLEVEGWNNLKIGFFYVRVTPTWGQIEDLSHYFLNTHIVMADMNLDPRRDEDLKKLRSLCGLKRKRILNENTTTRSNQLDHIFIRNDLAKSAFSTSYINHSSDHRTITVRLPLRSSADFSKDFMKEFHLNNDQWTRKKTTSAHKDEDIVCDFSELKTIDQYLDIIRSNCLKQCIVLDTAFAQSYLYGDDNDCSKYKNHQIISSEALVIPFHYSEKRDTETFVMFAAIIWSKEIIKVYWPYNSTEESTVAVADGIIEYLKALFSSFEEEFPEVKGVTQVICPAKLEAKDYWVYLLTAMKKYVLVEAFDEEKFDVKKELSILERELKCQKLFQKSTSSPKPRRKEAQTKKNPKPSSSQKRSHSPEVPVSTKKKKGSVVSSMSFIKTFKNNDFVSCWLNSSMQVGSLYIISLFYLFLLKAVLAALSHLSEVPNSSSKSNLYKLFLNYMNDTSSRPLDSTEVKMELFQKEKNRIICDQVVQDSRLFHFAYTSSTDPDELDVQERSVRLTQQDSQDFFVGLHFYRDHFPDVYDLFKYTEVNYTVCSICGGKSQSESTECIKFLSLPTNKITMAQHIIQQFNESTLVSEWRHEEGNECRKIYQNAEKFSKIKDIYAVQFLVVKVGRVDKVNNKKRILQTEVPVGGDVKITDFNGASATFKPIAVIHHSGGGVLNDDTYGHYQADVLLPQLQHWFRTSDDAQPLPLRNPSTKGYIFVYKKVDKVNKQ